MPGQQVEFSFGDGPHGIAYPIEDYLPLDDVSASPPPLLKGPRLSTAALPITSSLDTPISSETPGSTVSDGLAAMNASGILSVPVSLTWAEDAQSSKQKWEECPLYYELCFGKLHGRCASVDVNWVELKLFV